MIAAGPNGSALVAYALADAVKGPRVHAVMLEQNQRWSGPRLVSSTAGPAGLTARVAMGPSGDGAVLWAQSTRRAQASFMDRESGWPSISSELGPSVPPPAYDPLSNGALEVWPDGRVLAIWVQGGGVFFSILD